MGRPQPATKLIAPLDHFGGRVGRQIGVGVVLVHQRDVVENVLLRHQHLAHAVVDDDRHLAREGRTGRPAHLRVVAVGRELVQSGHHRADEPAREGNRADHDPARARRPVPLPGVRGPKLVSAPAGVVRTRYLASGDAGGPACQYMPPRTWAASSWASSKASKVETASMYWRAMAALISSISVCYFNTYFHTVNLLISITYVCLHFAFQSAISDS